MSFGFKTKLLHAAAIGFLMTWGVSGSADEATTEVLPDFEQDMPSEVQSVDEQFQFDESLEGDLDLSDSTSNPQWANQCQRYNNNPYQCNRVRGCQYSRIYSQCLQTQGPGPGPGPGQRFCSNYNYNYAACVQAGCRYDGNSGACYNAGPGPGPGPRPRSWSCFAFDTGNEEHRGGHGAAAYNRYDAERQALGLCQRYHGRCYIQSCRQN